MISRLSKEIAAKTDDKNGLDKDVLAYGIEMLLSTLLNVILMLCIAFIFHLELEMVIYMISFGALRMSAGGYHAKSHFTCFLSYLIISVCGILSIRLIPTSIYGIIIVISFSVSMIIIFIFAPTQTPHRPIFSKERIKFRKRSIFLGFFFIILTSILAMFKIWIPALTISIAIFTESLTLIQFNRLNYMEE